jgi:hypothetical protein
MALTDIQTLTNAQFNQSAYLPFNTVLPSNQGLSITFDFYSYGGSGADGISFFLVDGTQPINSPGGFGGSLGYAPILTDTGLQGGIKGGYLGVGFDEFGNFSSPTSGRTGGIGVVPNSVAVRGSQATNYAFLTGNSLPTGTTLSVPGPTATQAKAKRSAEVDLTPDGSLTVKIDLNGNGNFNDPGEVLINNFNVVASGNGILPSTFRLGFAASTGAQTNIHQVGNFTVKNSLGQLIPGDFTPNLIQINTSGGSSTITGGTGNNTLISGKTSDTLTGGTGNNTFVANGGDVLTAGTSGTNRFYFSGATYADALRKSTFSSRTTINNFAYSPDSTQNSLIGFVDDSSTTSFNVIGRPKALFNAGKETGSLRKAVTSAFASKNQKNPGTALKSNEAVFFRLGSRAFIAVNDRKAAFSPTNDFLAEVTGIQLKAGDRNRGALKVNDYFA